MEKTFSGSPVGNEASSAALAKAGVWQRDWFWISLLWLFKLGVDVIFWKNQAAEYVLDNIDYLDYAKQYFYAKDAATFYGIFLSSFGRIRSPFQSWLIFIGKRTFRHVSFEAIAYLIQAACLLFLTVAALQISKRIVELWGRQWSFPCTLALSAGIIFAPLAVGLSRGTLVELMLAATIVGTSWLCFKISRNGNANQVCALNLLVAAGALTKFSYPLYVFIPLGAILVYAVLRRKYSVIFLSFLFQLLVQVGFCYNIVNFKPTLATAKSVMRSWQVHYPLSMFHEIAISGFGVPFLGFVAFLGVVAVQKGFADRLTESFPARWHEFLLSCRQQHPTFEVVVMLLAAANFILMLAVHLRATQQMLRYYLFFVAAGVVLSVAVFAAMDLRLRTKGIVAGIFAAANLAVCALFSVPTTATSCSHPLLAAVFNIDCQRAEPVDGTLVAPRSANYHVDEIVRLLSGRIAPGSKVVLVNPNEYFNHQNVYYRLRDAAAREGFYFNITDIGRGELQNQDLWRDVRAAIVKDFTGFRYEVFVEDSPGPEFYAPSKLAELNTIVGSKLAQLEAREIYRNTNGDGTVSVYLIGK
jgi:hypothetical protein